MITSAKFHHFLALRETSVHLEPFTVIVGPNSSGKSTLLGGLDAGVNKRFQNQFAKPGPMATPQAEVSLETRYRSEDYQSATPPLRQSLPTVCTHLQRNDPNRFALVESYLVRVIPSIQGVNCLPLNSLPVLEENAASRPEVQAEHLRFNFENTLEVSALDVGQGTLAVLAVLLATLSAAHGPLLVLLDNLEQSLHPQTSARLVEVLRAIQAENPMIQIVAATHSPYLVDQFEPREVRVAAFDPQRGTVLAPLTQCPDFAKWSPVLRAGELWSYVGEAWTLEHNGFPSTP